MAVTFSGSNLERYRITDWDQLIGIKSIKHDSLKIFVHNVNFSGAVYKLISIYCDDIAQDFVRMLIGCNNDTFEFSESIYTPSEVVNILNVYGFPVDIIEAPLTLNEYTLKFLSNMQAVGFETISFIPKEGLMLYMPDLKNPVEAKTFKGFYDCDFTLLVPGKLYKISSLINGDVDQ